MKRFIPQLEVLEDRANPAPVAGGLAHFPAQALDGIVIAAAANAASHADKSVIFPEISSTAGTTSSSVSTTAVGDIPATPPQAAAGLATAAAANANSQAGHSPRFGV